MSSRPQTFRWLPSLAALSALLLHAGMILAVQQLAAERSATADAAAAGTGGIEIDLGMEGAYEDRVASTAASAPTPVPEQAAPTPVIQNAVAPDAVASEPQKAKPRKQVEKKPLKPAPTQQTQPTPTPAPQDNTAPADGKDAQTESAMLKASGTGSSRRAGGMTGDEKNYYSELKRWLDRHKDYPTQAKKEKQQGTVVVRFSINRAGEVISADIKRSSGNALLDQAALELLRKASPVPALPDSMPQQTLNIALPIDYSLLTK